jgi:hypothetical protein
MFEKIKLTVSAAIAALALAAPAGAAVVSMSGPLSSLGAAAQIIATPSEVFDDALTSDGIAAFNEKQGIVLPVDVTTDAGTLAAGTRLDSHIVFMNGVTGKKLTHGSLANPVEILFSGPILGIITNPGTIGISSAILGLSSATYDAPFALIGDEAHDYLSFSGSILSLALKTWKPGDWIRVVTLAPVAPPAVPLPAAGLLLIAGLGGLATLRSRKTVTA